MSLTLASPARRTRPGLNLVLIALLSAAAAEPLSAQVPGSTNAVAPGTAVPATDPAAAKVDELLARLRDLERREAERARADEQAREELARKFQSRIAELESKVRTLESGRVLPEIAVTPNPGPSNEELDQKLRILERRNELAAEDAAAKAAESPRVSLGAEGFKFSSADTNFVLRLRGLVQVDTRTFIDDHPLSEGNDGFLVRRARPILEATVYRDFDFLFVPDFAGTTVQLQDASIAYRFQPEHRFRIGKFKGPVGYENLLSDSNGLFNERALVSNLLPSRNVGAELDGGFLASRVAYAAGIFNATGDGRNPGNAGFGDDPEFAARLNLQPFKPSENEWINGLAFGVGASYSQSNSNVVGLPATTGGTRPGFTTTARQQFFAYNYSPAGAVVANGVHWRLSPYLTWVKGPFGVLGEYIVSDQEVQNTATRGRTDLAHTAWQASAQWVLSGESASFGGILPLRPFKPADGGWGAWQLVGRVTGLAVDPDAFDGFANPLTAASDAFCWSVGVNWWLNKNLRILTSFEETTFKGGGRNDPTDATTLVPPATVTHQDEKAVLTRIQLAF